MEVCDLIESIMIYEGKRVDYVSGKLASDGTLASTDSERERREEEPTIILQKQSLGFEKFHLNYRNCFSNFSMQRRISFSSIELS